MQKYTPGCDNKCVAAVSHTLPGNQEYVFEFIFLFCEFLPIVGNKHDYYLDICKSNFITDFSAWLSTLLSE